MYPFLVQRRQRLAGRGAADGRQRRAGSCADEARRSTTHGLRLLLRPRTAGPHPRRLLAGRRRPAARARQLPRRARTSTTPATTTARFNTEPRIASYIGIAVGQIPATHYFKMWRTFPDTCDWRWQETKPEGVTRTYLGVDVFEGHYPYRGMNIVPTWGGSMFEALMVPLVVPEEEWGPRELGRQPPAVRRGADRARPRGGRLRLLGLLARRTTPTAATASTASTRSGWSRTATPPTRSGRSSTTASGLPGRARRAAGRRLRPGRRHAARLVPRPRLRPGGGAGQPRQPAPRTSTCTAAGGFKDAVNVATGKVARCYLALDQGMVIAAIANELPGDGVPGLLRAGRSQAAVRPLMAMEEFTRRVASERPRATGKPGSGARARGEPASRRPSLPPPSGTRRRVRPRSGHAHWEPVRRRDRLSRPPRADADGPFVPLDHGGREVPPVPRPTTATRPASPARPAGTRSPPSPRRRRSQPASCPSRSQARPPPTTPRAGRGERRRRTGRRAGSMPVVADDRRGAALPARPEARAWRSRRSATSSPRRCRLAHDELGVARRAGPRDPPRRPRRLPRGGRRAGLRLHRHRPHLRPGARDSGCGRSSRSASCRATSPATRTRPCSSTRGIISPPRDWDRWGELVGGSPPSSSSATGSDEVARWGFEIWNEANLEVFWAGTQRRVLPPLRRRARGRSRRSTSGCSSAVRRRRRPAGSTRCSIVAARRARRSTSCPPTPTATPRSTCGRSPPVTAGSRRRAVVDRVGRPRRPLQPRSTTPSSARLSSCAG